LIEPESAPVQIELVIKEIKKALLQMN